MKDRPFETVIPCAPIDLNKLPFVVESVLTHTDTIGVHIITPDPAKVPSLGWTATHVFLHADQEVLNINPKALFKYRPNWVYQQFLKLFQDVTRTDWFLVIDADLLFNHYVPLFVNGRPQLLFGLNQDIGSYFAFNEKMIGIGKVHHHSFLSECTLYDKMQIRNMLQDNGYRSCMHFIEKAASIIDAECFPAESELYGSYICATQPDLYDFRYLKAALGGKYGGKPWTDDEIRARIREIAPQDADIFTIHSWEGEV